MEKNLKFQSMVEEVETNQNKKDRKELHNKNSKGIERKVMSDVSHVVIDSIH